jgi:4-hydroxyphenylpyruvate dioxygenase
MANLFENPLDLDGFEFIEFSAPKKGVLEPVFLAMGFKRIARHRSKDADLWRQGEINLVANYEPASPAAHFAAEHGPSVCAMGFRVKDASLAYAAAIERGAEPIESWIGPMELRIPTIRGVGGGLIYLVEHREDGPSIYDIDFDYLPGVYRKPQGAGLRRIDHLTHAVYAGRMAHWGGFYERVFGFRETRYFAIRGEYSGLTSRAMSAPDQKIRIPLAEEAQGGRGQIAEFLRAHTGEGVQHIAFLCDDLIGCWDRLKALGVRFMTPPSSAYYGRLDERLPGHGESVEALEARGILLDGVTGDGAPRLLLQIFSKPALGPVFFEFIQRKGDEGFGEGNFNALFRSMERELLPRGVFAAAAE